jgi:triosephosphate isomerase
MKIIASNFKTNHTRASTQEFINFSNAFIKNNNIKNNIYIFPPSSCLNNFELQSNITLGVQNAYYCKSGAFTGELGLEQLNEFNIKSILIGHSERRVTLQESNEDIIKKFNFYKELGFKIMYCIGESLDIKKQGDDSVMAHLTSQLQGIDLDYKKLIIAYEPIWAIGTGVSATNEDITSIHTKLKTLFKCPLLYGGSVNEKNLDAILKLDNVDGALIGSSSLVKENFAKLIQITVNN